MLADALLRAEDLDELAELVRHDAPSHAEVPAERQRLVLERDEDPAEARVDAVAEREVDDAVRPAEIDRRFGPFLGQRVEAFAHATRQHHHESVVLHVTSASAAFACARARGASSFQRGGACFGLSHSLARGGVMISPARGWSRSPVPSLTCPDTSPMIDAFSQVSVTRSRRLEMHGRSGPRWA